MSLVDYRADGFGAMLLLSAWALLEANRRRGRRWLAALCGLLAALAAGMTQKLAFVAVGSLAGLWALDRLRRADSAQAPLLRAPGALAAAAAAALAVGLAAAAAAGVLSAGLATTLVDAVRHEALYPESSSSFGEFAAPFLRHTWFTTLPILGCAALHLASREGRFWLPPLAFAVAAGALQRAQFPYNYVLPCLVLALSAVRGLGALVARVPARWRPLAWLVPLALLPNQLGFTAHASSNASQLALLDKIEAYSREDDAVIDGAGGALFRPHGSYYWQHGEAHRRMYAEVFETRLVDDYRRSAALFWIDDFRQRKLPAPVRAYFAQHYAQVDGSLYALGFQTEPTGAEAREFAFELLRSGAYSVVPRAQPPARPAIDGKPLTGVVRLLRAGTHVIRVGPHAPAWAVVLLPPAALHTQVAHGPHTRLFEYEWREQSSTTTGRRARSEAQPSGDR
jgi:hypothetical protein